MFRPRKVAFPRTKCVNESPCPFLRCKKQLQNRRFGKCPKCAKEFFNRFRNYMKTRYLAYRNFGRKCVKKLQKVFAFQYFFVSLQPLN